MSDPVENPPVQPGQKPTSGEVRAFAVNGKRAPDHALLNSSITLAVALCGMLAAILVPYITGRQQMALTLAILNSQQKIAVEQAKNATETKSILTKVDGRLTAALDAKATALEQVAELKPKNVVARTIAQAARKEAKPPPVAPTPVPTTIPAMVPTK